MSGYGTGAGAGQSSYPGVGGVTNNKINIRQRNKDWLKPVGVIRNYNKKDAVGETQIRQEALQICQVLKQKKIEVIIPTKGSGSVKIKTPMKTVVINDVKAEIEKEREAREYMKEPYCVF